MTEGAIDVQARAVPLARIAQEWNDRGSGERLVFVP